MTQYSLKKGLSVLGVPAEEAVVKELQQMKDMDAFFPVDPTTLTGEQQKRALASLMFLKEKRDGTVKGRACAVGTSQREYIKKEDAASPTAATESVFITSVIAAHEERGTAIFDILGAFWHALTDEDVLMLLEGPLAELMVKVGPSLYRKYVTTNSKGKSQLYVKIHKALYGMLRSALLFYRKLVVDLEAYVFKINPYI